MIRTYLNTRLGGSLALHVPTKSGRVLTGGRRFAEPRTDSDAGSSQTGSNSRWSVLGSYR